MGKFNLKYSDRLILLDMKTLESRRKFKQLQLLWKIKNQPHLISENWRNIINFKTTRNGIFVDISYNRLHSTDHHIFYQIANLFNSLKLDFRQFIESNEFLKFIKDL
jgi:hypothetical protein